ncbi:MAG: hypothetical protein QOG89_1955 [Thermomicrobiales bacterium]|nr:hypothetical protein [Thermomicrobiales bacterium]
MTASPEIARLITESWSSAKSEAAAGGRDLFPGAMTRLINWSVEDRTLTLDLGVTDYREFVGTNLRHPELAVSHGREALANPLGVSVAVTTADGKLLVQRRSEQVFEYPGFFHVCGGNVEPADVADAAASGVFATVRRELDEELGIAPVEIVDLICLGLAEDRGTLKPDLLFEAQVSLTADAFATSTNAEYSALAFVEGEEALAAFLVEHVGVTSPAGLACLLAVGRHRYGEAWSEGVVARLRASQWRPEDRG